MPPLAVRDLPKSARKARQQGSTFYVIGDSRTLLRDAYHVFLRWRWSAAIAAFAAAFFAINLVFAVAYYLGGGVANSRGTFFHALSFSVETFATVGYGQMYPESDLAHWIMIVQSLVSVITTAVATGLIFAKFARPTARIAFSRFAVITQHDGHRTLIFRAGNRRSNMIVEATIHVVAMVTTTTAEGKTFYKAVDLPMVRDRQVGMTRGWTLMHTITPDSPLYGATAESLKTRELELYISLTGIDDVSMQTVHALHKYVDDEVKIDHHLVDTVVALDNGEFMIDLTKFDAIAPDRAPDRPDSTPTGATAMPAPRS